MSNLGLSLVPSSSDAVAAPGPREQLLSAGGSSLSDIDLLTILLGTGVSGQPASVLAAKLLSDSGGLRSLSRMSAHELAQRRGVGVAKAARILAAFELGHRAGLPLITPEPIAGASDVQRWAVPALGSLEHEEVWLLSLNAKHQVISRRRIALGGAHGCALTPKDVLRPAIRDCACAIVLVHNHPSGDCAPSASDIEMTQIVAQAALLVGMQLLDHVVVSAAGFTSLLEIGALDPKAR
ncbi:MAG TPA: DNA repair protein RadC [Polyangiaceae bacterium]|nr:DNA repair protein RadC [Polyangiaceae bacterium]